MGRGKEFFRGMSKTRLKEVIREEIAAVDFGQEFESSLIADLILQKHYHCAAQRLRPSLFRKLHRHGAAYDFQSYFPAHGWHGVSWTQCIDSRDEMAWLDRALRDAVHPIIPAIGRYTQYANGAPPPQVKLTTCLPSSTLWSPRSFRRSALPRSRRYFPALTGWTKSHSLCR